MKKYLLFLLMTSVVQPGQAPNETGTVSGRVYMSTEDQPVADANVYLETLDRPSPRQPSITKTNSEGRFSIEAVPGKYAVHAFKREEGYPDVFFAFNLAPGQKLKEVTITAGQHLDGIDIRLGPKPAVLSFTVTDAETGSVLSSVDYELCQFRHPDWCLRGGAPGKTEFSAPATEIMIQLSSAGYETKKHTENGKAYVSLAPGEHKEVSVALRRGPTR
jgi:Carboxypeptidase regulatory-like domain